MDYHNNTKLVTPLKTKKHCFMLFHIMLHDLSGIPTPIVSGDRHRLHR
jgi:hypothetical protein